MKSLFFICLLLVLSGMAVSLTREYIYVSNQTGWERAQANCRKNYGDLATITTKEENQKAINSTGQNIVAAWIGLCRALPQANLWMWSSGEEQDFRMWFNGKPDQEGDCVSMSRNGWSDDECYYMHPAICSRTFILVKESQTWEAALQYCRRHYRDLVMVDSETQLDVLKTESKTALTASVWTGLRFLHGTWLWVNGKQVESLVSLTSCPVEPYRCGAYNFDMYIFQNRDCNKKLNFICYY